MNTFIIFFLILIPIANAQIETLNNEQNDSEMIESIKDMNIFELNQEEEIYYEEPDLELGGSEYINYAQDEFYEENP